MSFNTRYTPKISDWRWPFSVPATVGTLLTLLFVWLLLSQNLFIALGVALGIVAFVLVTRYPALGLYLMVFSVPAQDKLGVSVGGGGRITLTQVAVLLTLSAWFINRVAFNKPLVRRPTPPLVPFFLLYLGAQIISISVATSTSDSLAEISRWCITIFAYLLATNIIETRRQFWTLVICLVLGAVGEAGLGVVQTRLGVGPESFAINEDLTRAFGTFEFPNPYAGYLEMALPLLVALTFWNWHERNKTVRQSLILSEAGQPCEVERRKLFQIYLRLALLVPATALVTLAVVASYSRGAWLGLMAGALMMVAIRGKKSTGIWIILALGLLFGALALQTGVVSPTQAQRLSSIAEQLTPFDVRGIKPNDENFAVVERMAMWQAGGNMFLYNPWLGIGIGNYNDAYPSFYAGDWIISRGHAHNYYIHAAAETGIVGLTAYLALILTAYALAFRAYRQTTEAAFRYIIWGGFGVLTAIMIHNIVENLHVLNLGIQWSAILALFYLIPRLESHTKEESLS